MGYTHQTTIFMGKLMRNHWVLGILVSDILVSDKPIWQNLDGETTHTGSELLITESIKIATKPKVNQHVPISLTNHSWSLKNWSLMMWHPKISVSFSQNYPNNQSFARMLAGSLHPRILGHWTPLYKSQSPEFTLVNWWFEILVWKFKIILRWTMIYRYSRALWLLPEIPA